MGILSLVGRIDGYYRRAVNLQPIAEAVKQRLWEGNRAAVLAGLSPDGTPVAPLRPSTLARRKGTGPPRAPRGAGSRVVTGCVINVRIAPGALTFTQSWPGFTPVIEYLDGGTPRMVARPTLGFRREDLEWVRETRRRYWLTGGTR